MNDDYDFSGWATKNNILCSDGRIIRKDAFKHCDGKMIPIVWNHMHNDPTNVLGKARLENRNEGVYAYCYLNNTPKGQHTKELIKHGDIESLSICANGLKQRGNEVLYGDINELSIVYKGANMGALIDSVMAHNDSDDEMAILYNEENSFLCHSDDPINDKEKNDSEAEETVEDVFETLSEKQKNVVYAMIGQALEEGIDEKDESEGGNTMKHNAFDQDEQTTENTLCHADMTEIIKMAKNSSVGSLQSAISIYTENDDTLTHGIDDIETLFPEYKDVRPGAPELIQRDQGWVSAVMRKVHKSPISRIRTRQADIRGNDLRASGYLKGKKKNVAGNIKLLKRTTDPQTVYRKDALNRDDIIDIDDFDVVSYQYNVMKQNLEEEIALAIMIGDGRDEGDENKISEEHIRPIWLDDDLYTIHAEVDINSAKKELQGTNTNANFGDNYVYAEAIITSALYAREKYKGTGNMDFFCTPHMLNVMLLARDMNGRRIYSSKADLATALDVNEIYTAEQFEGKIRSTKDNKKKKLLGIFVNLGGDYSLGSSKGGEITKFNQFDIDFNQEKYLIETRLSGATTRVYSSIVLEEPVVEVPEQPTE